MNRYSNHMNIFFLVWRNGYIKRLIRNSLLRDRVINFTSLAIVNQNHGYLDTLTIEDKLENNIFIRLVIKDTITFLEYINTPDKRLVNDLIVCVVDGGGGDSALFDWCVVFKEFGHLHRLELEVSRQMSTHGIQLQLPHSITDLRITRSLVESNDQFYSEFIQEVLRCLPDKLCYLSLPNGLTITTEVVLPGSVVDLEFESTFDNLCRLRVPPNRVFPSCRLKVRSPEALDWLQGQRWITSVLIARLWADKIDHTFNTNILPSRVCALEIHYQHDYRVELFERHSLPSNLESFTVFLYNRPIGPHVLPSTLKVLNLSGFNHELEMGILPNTLTSLNLSVFNKELKPMVLPNQLQTLSLDSFKNNGLHLSPNSLPPSLTCLNLPSYYGSFSSVGPLKKLSVLSLYSLGQCQSIIDNIFLSRRLEISFQDIDQGINLQLQTHIKHLYLHYIGLAELIVDSKEFILPPSLFKLTTYNIDLRNNDQIPEGCIHITKDNDK
ncbi:hypothetical protein CYY_008362 [Polysphondylium violaceum]|uniref:FNIP repeat-containing protein n=1 Tax=Polysphondylium violaceum TaxID=133409 RepID=A0A8J4PNH8_9MYCE|nr:hypothetical protein CYY_008362 [Polysphondylium violaceum]